MDFTPTEYDEDAFMQKVNLDKRYTKTWKVSTVNVVAEAHHRSVYIEESSSSPPHNISTMRDLAAAIEEACLFVEECNPNWARDIIDTMFLK